eukprot:CAMPEP_0176491590 /NCGR_PEP_ID=MMETSP0200_2-20121128/8517_1 /TAXON_ID=947934 /ORGANISM="Chaetoceros sp., Strain GSL56" /LENGTH=403 /DNA_ID=CAMNT_0017889037 /DNA_START=104 /DNA_END=1315 /DNA_ORIENTATION=+
MNILKPWLILIVSTLWCPTIESFLPVSPMVNRQGKDRPIVFSTNSDVDTIDPQIENENKRQTIKSQLFGLLGANSVNQKLVYKDTILADPQTKEPLEILTVGTLVGGQDASPVKVILKSSERTYQGRSDTFFDLLRSSSIENSEEKNDFGGGSSSITKAFNSVAVLVPPPLRRFLPMGEDYIPMRDLFTSPQVSFAYERGWRQGFAAAGFPGADKEYDMVREYFRPINPDVVIDMSCATGLFTRRLVKGGDYKRVIGCDYSESMLNEARRRIRADADLLKIQREGGTKVDLVRCDVGEIPMADESVPAFHAGAAMHCWPDLDAALSEIYRVLKPGGRFFASTFLATYFSNVQALGGNNVNTQAFQYFASTNVLKELLLKAGFQDDKINIEVFGTSCVIIRAEK